jgi:hypothetical protein
MKKEFILLIIPALLGAFVVWWIGYSLASLAYAPSASHHHRPTTYLKR